MWRRFTKVACVVVAIMSSSTVAIAEVLGPLLPSRTLEVGVMERKTNRLMERNNEQYISEGFDYPVTLRYGVTSGATLSFELSAYPNSWLYESDVVSYTVGAGITTLIWLHGDLAITTGAHYYRTLNVDREPGRCDLIVQGIDWTLLGEQSFDVGPVGGVFWGGPTVSYHLVEAQAPCDEETATPEDVVGGVVGLTLASRIGIVLQGSYVWIGESEYRLSLAYRF